MGDDAPRPDGRRPTSRPGRRTAFSAVLTPPTGVPTSPERTANPSQPARSEGPVSSAGTGIPALVPPRAPVAVPPVVDPCVCRHAREAHEHWRPGTDCGVCGPSACSRYRRRGGALRRFLRRVHLVR
jgi:hypothetical protein